MAQVNESYPDLTSMFGAASTLPAILGMERFKQAQQAQQINMAGAQQEQAIQAKRAPMDLEHIMAQTQHMKAQNPLLEAQTEQTRLKNEEMSATKDARIKEVLTKLSNNTDEEGLKRTEISLRQMLTKPDLEPGVRQRLEQALSYMPKIYEMKLGLEERRQTSIEQEGMRQDGQNQREAAALAAGKYAKAGVSKYNLSIEQQLAQMKKATERISFIQFQLSLLEDDDPRRRVLERMYAEQVPLARAEQAAAAGIPKAGGVDIRGVTEGAVPTNPEAVPPAIAPRAPGAAAPSGPRKTTYTLQELKTIYPNKSEEELRKQATARGITIQ